MKTSIKILTDISSSTDKPAERIEALINQEISNGYAMVGELQVLVRASGNIMFVATMRKLS